MNIAFPNRGVRQEEVLKSTDQPKGMNSYICNASEGAERCNVSPAGQAANTELDNKSWQVAAECSTLMDSSQRMRWEKRGVRCQGNSVFLTVDSAFISKILLFSRDSC